MTEHGYPFSLPCEPNGSGELKINWFTVYCKLILTNEDFFTYMLQLTAFPINSSTNLFCKKEFEQVSARTYQSTFVKKYFFDVSVC